MTMAATVTAAPSLTVADLLRRLEEGVAAVQDSASWTHYLAAMARLHSYSARNIWLALAQRPDATRLGGFHTWRALGRHVRKGEHGIRILAPVTVRKADDGEDETQTVTRFRTVVVFDVSQTDGADLPAHPCQTLTTDSERGRWLYEHLLDAARTRGTTVRQDMAGLGTAHGVYVPGVNAIGLAPGLAMDQKAKTLCHELAHAVLAHGSTARSRDEEEAEAEGTAFVVAAWAGLDTSAYSFGYVADWAQRKDAVALVKRVGGNIQRAAAAILARLDPAEARRTA